MTPEQITLCQVLAPIELRPDREAVMKRATAIASLVADDEIGLVALALVGAAKACAGDLPPPDTDFSQFRD